MGRERRVAREAGVPPVRLRRDLDRVLGELARLARVRVRVRVRVRARVRVRVRVRVRLRLRVRARVRV